VGHALREAARHLGETWQHLLQQRVGCHLADEVQLVHQTGRLLTLQLGLADWGHQRQDMQLVGLPEQLKTANSRSGISSPAPSSCPSSRSTTG
jgi:hypothetical protein